MWRLRIEQNFDAAHYLRDYKGPCAHMHGHSWKVCVYIVDDKQDKTGICVDFKDLKSFLESFLDRYDHKCLNEIEPFTVINPTAENLSKTIYDALQIALELNHSTLEKVRVYESSTSYAEYWDENGKE